MLIYKCTNLINNKVYIGLTIRTLNHRKSRHLYDAKHRKYNSYFHSAIRKYGESNFKWETIHTAKTKNELISLEIKEISKHRSSEAKFGYNLTLGGESHPGKTNPFYGKHHSEEQKAKWSNQRKGKNTGSSNYFYDKHYANESNPFYGNKHSAETKTKIADANARCFEITDVIHNKTFTVKNLRQFARDNNLSQSGLKSASRTGYLYRQQYYIKRFS